MVITNRHSPTTHYKFKGEQERHIYKRLSRYRFSTGHRLLSASPTHNGTIRQDLVLQP